MYKNKERCKKCVYGWLPTGMDKFFKGQPACLYFHDTEKHRDGDDKTCNSFKKLTPEEIKERREGRREEYEHNRAKTYY